MSRRSLSLGFRSRFRWFSARLAGLRPLPIAPGRTKDQRRRHPMTSRFPIRTTPRRATMAGLLGALEDPLVRAQRPRGRGRVHRGRRPHLQPHRVAHRLPREVAVVRLGLRPLRRGVHHRLLAQAAQQPWQILQPRPELRLQLGRRRGPGRRPAPVPPGRRPRRAGRARRRSVARPWQAHPATRARASATTCSASARFPYPRVSTFSSSRSL